MVFRQSVAGWVGALLLLAGCGGGGSSGDVGQGGTGNDSNGPRVLSGRVIFDAPVPDAEVMVRDTAGTTWTARTNADGDYTIAVAANVDVRLPVVATATGTGRRWVGPVLGTDPLSAASLPLSIDRPAGVLTYFELYAIADADGVAHITPVSTLLVQAISGNRARSMLNGLGRSASTPELLIGPEEFAQAQRRIREVLARLGLDASLLDAPKTVPLEPVAVGTAWERLVSGDVLGAVARLLYETAVNVAVFGCNGAVWGVMSDGQPRPSCLPGPNLDGSAGLRFELLFPARSLDHDSRASELAGGDDGWMLQAPSARLAPIVREELLRAKINGLMKATRAYAALPDSSIEAKAAMETWTSAEWDEISSRVGSAVQLTELSDYTFSFLAMRAAMKHRAPTPRTDAAEGLFSTWSNRIRAVDRVAPVFFESGLRRDAMPVLREMGTNWRSGLTFFQAVPLMGPLQDYTDRALVALAELERMVSTAPSAAGPYFGPVDSSLVDLAARLSVGGAADAGAAAVDAATSIVSSFVTPTSSCPNAVDPLTHPACQAVLDAIARTRAMMPSWIDQVPVNKRGTFGEPSKAQLFDSGAAFLAPFLMAVYVNSFANIFEDEAQSGPLFEPFEVRGYITDYTVKADARELSVGSLSVKSIRLQSAPDGLDLSASGMFEWTRKDVSRPKQDGPVDPLIKDPPGLVSELRVHPSMVAHFVGCQVTDQACMGRLRRNRDALNATQFLPLEDRRTSVGDFDIMVLGRFRDVLRQHAAIEEVLPFRPDPCCGSSLLAR